MEEGTKIWYRNKNFKFQDDDEDDEDNFGESLLWIPSKIQSKVSNNGSKETFLLTIVEDSEGSFQPRQYHHM